MNGAREKTGWNNASSHFFKEEQDALEHSPFHRILYMLVTLANTGVETAFEKTAEVQTQVDQSLIACALERYRLAHGSYPSSLDALMPEYLTKIPNSPINGKPMNYSLNPEGTFLLWTPSWNLQSLGGKPGEYFGEGDIVWGQPVPKISREKAKDS